MRRSGLVATVAMSTTLSLFLNCRESTQSPLARLPNTASQDVYSEDLSLFISGDLVSRTFAGPGDAKTGPPMIQVPFTNRMTISGELRTKTPGQLIFYLKDASGVVVDSVGTFAKPDSNGKATFSKQLRVKTPGTYTLTGHYITRDGGHLVFQRTVNIYQH